MAGWNHEYHKNNQNLPTDILASVQILSVNPILMQDNTVKEKYFSYLLQLIKLTKCYSHEYSLAQLKFYKHVLCSDTPCTSNFPTASLSKISRYAFSLIFDIAAIVAFDTTLLRSIPFKTMMRHISDDFLLEGISEGFLSTAICAIEGVDHAWGELTQCDKNPEHSRYYESIRKNLEFIKKPTYGILITATMSAGKSTFINALVGKNINRVQNMACTSKIHTIYSKFCEDGYTTEYDDELIFDAGKEELQNDNENNHSDKIYVSTYFNGKLKGNRLILHDSPGVNSSENLEHKTISQDMIASQNYQLLIYVLNATQLGTTDDETHLEYVARSSGNKPVLFIMNRVDALLTDEESIESIIMRQKDFLQTKGYRNPIVCPISAKAAFLAKKSLQESLSRLETREFYTYSDLFEQNSLANYYENILKCPVIQAENDAHILLRNCGLTYIENIIRALIKNHEKNLIADTMREGSNQPVCPIHVISTISSGKSTLINALLRKKLMPSKNEACTTAITEILHINSPQFSATAYNKGNSIIRQISELTPDIMYNLNEDKNIFKISVQGRIPFGDSQSIAFKLVDTPSNFGMWNKPCRESIYHAISENSDGLIIYVLNAAQLTTNDDADQLRYIAEQIRKGGKQIRDRILFVVNKMDLFDPEEDDIAKTLQTVKRYLGSQGIENPQLFPCSASLAMNLQTYLADIDISGLSRAQERQLPMPARDTLFNIWKFITSGSMHLEKYIPLSSDTQQYLDTRLAKAIEINDTKEHALIHSGICSLEAAIISYALKNKDKFISHN